MNNYTVTELNEIIKKTITTEFKNKLITVSGEISNLKNSGNHTYLTLKDDTTTLSVAFWNKNLKNQNGEHVEVSGKMDYYIKSGNINFIGTNVKIIGVGSSHSQYEKIREEYEKKGYFKNRKSLPNSAKNIGVVTSYTGAALQDFMYVLKKNQFSGNVYIYDCNVQGIKCPVSVAQGIKFFNSPFNISDYDDKSDTDVDTDADTETNSDSDAKTSHDLSKGHREETIVEVEVDIIVVTRGGGSFEDLMGFSSPKVIDAVHGSKKYIISAVGHEIDNMLSDYAANYRAPTPSIAGEVIVSIGNKNKMHLDKLQNQIYYSFHEIKETLLKYKIHLKQIDDSLVDPSKILNDKIYLLHKKAKNHIQNEILMYRKKIDDIDELLISNDSNMMLNQGFIVLTKKNGDIITQCDKMFNKKIVMITNSGNYEVIIKKI